MPVTRYYYWIVAQEDGKPYLIFGSDRTEADALRKGREMLPGTDFKVKRLPTRDLGRASSLLKGGRLEETHSIKEATRRLGHEKSAAHRLKKRDERLTRRF